MKAVILAAGEGTRLRPLTFNTPKVLLPIAGVPLLVLILLWLRRHNITEVALNLHHLGEKIRDFLGDGSDFGLKVAYSHEDVLLGTAGGVKRMECLFGGTFVVVYGDVLADFDLTYMIRLHQDRGALATLAVKEVPSYWEVGVVRMGEDPETVFVTGCASVDLAARVLSEGMDGFNPFAILHTCLKATLPSLAFFNVILTFS